MAVKHFLALFDGFFGTGAKSLSPYTKVVQPDDFHLLMGRRLNWKVLRLPPGPESRRTFTRSCKGEHSPSVEIRPRRATVTAEGGRIAPSDANRRTHPPHRTSREHADAGQTRLTVGAEACYGLDVIHEVFRQFRFAPLPTTLATSGTAPRLLIQRFSWRGWSWRQSPMPEDRAWTPPRRLQAMPRPAESSSRS